MLLLLLTVLLCLSFNNKNSNAETSQTNGGVCTNEDSGVSTYGLVTNLNFSFDGGNGEVWYAVKNKFTLFPATVIVYVYLYRSDTYQENYEDMTLVATGYTPDLDQGDRISATAPTNLQKGYWKGRAYYKIDNKAWQERITETAFLNEHGVRI